MTKETPHYAGQAPGDRDRRIPSLDGLRAISIALVIVSHLTRSAGFPESATLAWFDRFNYAQLGVRMFFVISGFLITGILVREMRRTETVDLRNFYLRRAFRIFPPFYAYVAVMLALGAVGALPRLSPVGLAHVLTYTVNYAGLRPGTWMTSHFWSLSIEEQFYFLWPPTLAWLGLRRGFRAALAFVIISPFLRLALYALFPAYHPYIGASFETSADALLTGCLLTWWRDDLWNRDWYRRLLSSGWMLLVPVAVLIGALLDGRPRLSYFIGIPVKNVGIALMLDWAVRFPAGRVGRVLNARAVAYIGVLSYSLYVWQQVFLIHAYESPLLRFPVNLVWACACALGSYYLIEQPALRLRARVERRWRARREAATQKKPEVGRATA